MATPTRTQQSIDAQIAQLEQELLELKRQRNELSPVSTIPPEILCQILLLATSYSEPQEKVYFVSPPDGFRVERCTDTLLHVSHSWRSAALGCPQLWLEIDIRMASDARRIDFMVKHAHPLSISLHVNAVAPVHPTWNGPIP